MAYKIIVACGANKSPFRDTYPAGRRAGPFDCNPDVLTLVYSY